MQGESAAPGLKRRLLAVAMSLLAMAAAAGAWQAMRARTDRQARTERTACALPAPSASSPRPGMVWVPPGRLDLGDTVYDEEGPRRLVQVGGFWMDRTEVTNDAFAAFVQATGYVTVAERPVDTTAHPGLRPGQVAQQVIKGGSFLCAPDCCMRYRAGSRPPQDADLGASQLGFRTILVAAGP